MSSVKEMKISSKSDGDIALRNFWIKIASLESLMPFSNLTSLLLKSLFIFCIGIERLFDPGVVDVKCYPVGVSISFLFTCWVKFLMIYFTWVFVISEELRVPINPI